MNSLFRNWLSVLLITTMAGAHAQTPPQRVTQGQPAERYAPIKKQEDAEPAPELELFTGESRVFPAPGIARIAVGNGQVITANALDDKDVIIFANGAGNSTLFLWHQDGRVQRVKVTVLQADMGRYAREVATFLATIPKAKASVVGDKVVVEGDELSDADRDKVAELAKRYPLIVNFTSPIGWEQMVMMDVKVVEFPKTELRELGLKWSATGGAAVGGIWAPSSRGDAGGYAITVRTGDTNAPPISVPGGGSGSYVPLPSNLTILSAINLGLNAQLLALEQKGTASVLAEPQLSTRSGYKASFLAGGEIPYSVASINGVTVQFKPYGVKLDIEPKVGSNGVIRAVIESEVSSIDASLSTASGPALLTRRTKTEFNVRQGETIVLSGLLQRNSSTDIDKVPLLGDMPILGALFRSRRFQNKETELVVFVTPSIVDSRSAGLVDRTQRAGERLERNLGRQPYLSNPLQPGADAAGFNQAPAAAVPDAPAP
ncbi:type II and III secretion system protein family protein [Duganella levis]|uniref:Secretory apparatus n=1 Tax=Duganella levis TaxID=2692169 RepID=A0ABW9W554_9BURK|nr:pilus assembly protein N-terminal domain-containing protein [Duganella levis]MYN29171.1 secretory apparatus [Duganella levis]